MEKEKVREVLTTLKNDGYVGITIGFEGSGDSGDLQSICIFDSTEAFDMDVEYPWESDDKDYGDDFLDPLRDLANKVLSQSNYDWYNNDGGYGSVNIDLKTGQIKAHFQIRYTETNYYCDDFEAKQFTR
jgi:hypothetical protein